jgi:hypothetical protein
MSPLVGLPMFRSPSTRRFDEGQGQRSAAAKTGSTVSLFPTDGRRLQTQHRFNGSHSARESNAPGPGLSQYAPPAPSDSAPFSLLFPHISPLPSGFQAQHNEHLGTFSTTYPQLFEDISSNSIAGATPWLTADPAEHFLNVTGGAPTADFLPPAYTEELAVPLQAGFYASSNHLDFVSNFGHAPSSLSPDPFPLSNPGPLHSNIAPRIAGLGAEWRRTSNSPGGFASRCGIVSNHSDTTRCRTPARPLSLPLEAISHTSFDSSLLPKVLYMVQTEALY